MVEEGLIPMEISATASYVLSSSVTTGAELAGRWGRRAAGRRGEKETPACAAREKGIWARRVGDDACEPEGEPGKLRAIRDDCNQGGLRACTMVLS